MTVIRSTGSELNGSFANSYSDFVTAVGCFLQVGIGKHFWINIVLTLLGYIPGIVHAVWVIAKK